LGRKYDSAVQAGAGATFLDDVRVNFGHAVGPHSPTFGSVAVRRNTSGKIIAVFDNMSGFLDKWQPVRRRTGGFPIDIPYPHNFRREREAIAADLEAQHGVLPNNLWHLNV
jgi:hypothetical protein